MKINKKILFIGIAILFLFLLIFAFIQPPKNKSQKAEDNTSNTNLPTSDSSKNSVVKIINTTPTNNDDNVIPGTDITFFFQDDLSANSVQDITITSYPTIDFESTWKSNKILTIHPKNELKLSTKYDVSVLLKQRVLFKLTFTTSDVSTKEALDQINQQLKDDISFTQSVGKYKSENPWISKMPLKGDGYQVVFDPDDKKFIIIVLDNVPSDKRQETINNAISKIREINPAVSENDYYVYK